MQTRILRVLAAVSAASLLFSYAWFEITPGTLEQYVNGSHPTLSMVVALWLDIGLLAAVLVALSRLFESRARLRRIRFVGRVFVLVAVVEPARRVATQVLPSLGVAQLMQTLGRTGFVAIGLLMAITAAAVILRWRRHVDRIAAVMILALAPMPFVLSAHVLSCLQVDPPHRGSRPRTEQHRNAEVVLLIFDEWDYEYTYSRRPAHIAMPALDRLQENSTSFSYALPTSGETLSSVPAILTGEAWSESSIGLDGNVLLRKSPNEAWQPFQIHTSIFCLASRRGWRSHFIHWRLVLDPAEVAECPGLTLNHYDSDQRYREVREAYATFGGALTRPWLASLHGYTIARRLTSRRTVVAERARVVRKMMDELTRVLSEARHEVVVAHLAVPHEPAVYDARAGRFLQQGNPNVTSLDNMAVVDLVLAQVQRVLTRRGQWDTSLVIATSDHWQRRGSGDNFDPPAEKTAVERGHRVPLIIKFPGQTESQTVARRTSTTTVYEAVRRRISGKLDSFRSVSALVSEPRRDVMAVYHP